ncbi:hypothetical protein LCGC14_1098300 [marine sediment metagenome]|uniref:Uncharacterized protein n=1 Tax=marine sediment metagenome TaxID=412755 RepID=A0A0F9PTF0_9ZZZZ
MNYILDERGEPKAEPDVIAWAQWYESFPLERIVALDKGVGDADRVSTVFLAIDYNLSEEGPRILYETLVFGGDLDGETERYSTRAEAVIGHIEMVERVNANAPAPAGGEADRT